MVSSVENTGSIGKLDPKQIAFDLPSLLRYSIEKLGDRHTTEISLDVIWKLQIAGGGLGMVSEIHFVVFPEETIEVIKLVQS